MLSPEIFKAVFPLDYQMRFINQDRVSKQISLARNVIGTSLGSSTCKIGNTVVIVAVTAGIFVSPIEQETLGKLNVVCDYSLCLPKERRAAQSIASGVSDKIWKILDNFAIFDRAQLNESEGKVWDVTLNILVVRDDGALIDCALMAAVAAIQSTRLPSVEPRSLSLKALPVSFTFCLASEGKWLPDPSSDEESVFPRLTICVDDQDNICGMFGLEGPPSVSAFSMSDVVGGPVISEFIANKIVSRRQHLIVDTQTEFI